MNFAVAMLFRSSYSSNSELSVPRYAPNRTMSPVGDTRQENMTAPSFCPFLINSAASMVLITDFGPDPIRSEEHTSELQSRVDLVCRLLLEKKKNITNTKI